MGRLPWWWGRDFWIGGSAEVAQLWGAWRRGDETGILLDLPELAGIGGIAAKRTLLLRALLMYTLADKLLLVIIKLNIMHLNRFYLMHLPALKWTCTFKLQCRGIVWINYACNIQVFFRTQRNRLFIKSSNIKKSKRAYIRQKRKFIKFCYVPAWN